MRHACLALGLAACTGASTASTAAGVCAGAPDAGFGTPPDLSAFSGDPRAIASVRCASTDPADDLTVDVDETAPESGVFTVSFRSARPAALARSFCLTASWSGHFFNFGASGAGAHVRARGLPGPSGDYDGDDNAQIYTAPGALTTVLDAESLHCVAVRNGP